MHKVRIQFSKGGALRFIGHLDFLRVFTQAIRRAGLPAAYSQGYNPHILLSFALPLPLGMESVHDYADLTLAGVSCVRKSLTHEATSLTTPTDAEEMARRLQANAPEGLKIRRIFAFEGRGAAAITAAADYLLTVQDEQEKTRALRKAAEILATPSWVIPKKTKSGVKDADIRQDIFDIFAETEQTHGITLRLAASSGRFINPLTVAGILLGREAAACELKRMEMYEKVGESFIHLVTN